MSDIEDPVNVGVALNLLGRKRPAVAMCPRCDGEPLVFTFDMPGAEFHCLRCEGWFGFLAPRAAEEAPELLALVEQRKTEYRESKR